MVVPMDVCLSLPSLNLLSLVQPINVSLATNDVTSEPKHIIPKIFQLTLSLT